jgi:hypothetical protein
MAIGGKDATTDNEALQGFYSVTPSGTFYSTVAVSGTALSVTGSVAVTNSGSVIQGTSPWVVSGSVNIAAAPPAWTGVGSAFIAGGSIVISAAPAASASTDSILAVVSGTPLVITSGVSPIIGSVAITNTASIAGSVAITNIGSVIQSTNPWIVLGSAAVTNLVAGSIVNAPAASYATDSVKTVPHNVSFVGSAYNNSGNLVLWTPTTGSKFVMTDLMLSSDTAVMVRTYESGVATNMTQNYIGANATAMMTFNLGIKATTVTVPLMLGVAGSPANVFATVTGYSEG